MNKRRVLPDSPFVGVEEAAAALGVSCGYIRTGIRAGRYPCLRSGRVYRVNLPALRELLEQESRAGATDSSGEEIEAAEQAERQRQREGAD